MDMGAYETAGVDINDDKVVDAVDVQLVVNAALGFDVYPYDCDTNQDGAINALDIQMVIYAALGVA